MKDIVMQSTQRFNEIFNTNRLNHIAQQTGFIKRQKKIKANEFLENMLSFKLSNSMGSLEDLAEEFQRNNCPITKQALHKKFNERGTNFLQKTLEHLLSKSLNAPLGGLQTISFIRRIQVPDSSEIQLNYKLSSVYPHYRGNRAAVKLQALMDVVSHQMQLLEVRPMKEPDQAYKKPLCFVQQNDLWIADLGYFSVDTFRTVVSKDAFYLSRYFRRADVYRARAESGNKIDLKKLLSKTKSGIVDMEIQLGKSKLSSRLVAVKLPPEAYRKRLAKKARDKKRTSRSKKVSIDVLDRWTIFITNLPNSVVAKELLCLYSMRWQIELFFKMIKSFTQIKKIKDNAKHSALMSIYASLIAVVLLSYIVQTIIQQEISLYKAGKIFIKYIREFIKKVHHDTNNAVSWLRNILIKFALKESRHRRPSTRNKLQWEPCHA